MQPNDVSRHRSQQLDDDSRQEQSLATNPNRLLIPNRSEARLPMEASFSYEEVKSSRASSYLSRVSQEVDFWSMLAGLIPVRTIKIKIDKHTVVDEKSPFVLYALELTSNYSRYVAKKQYVNFVELQQRLLLLRDQVTITRLPNSNLLQVRRLEEVLPKLPTSILGFLFES